MNISKTLFKNLTRCPNASALYDLYTNRSFNEVKQIDGKDISKELIDDINSLDDNLFKEDSKIDEILSHMFDEETGEDLLEETNPQLEAFKDLFTEVERLAIVYLEKLFNEKIQSSTNTFEQKKYSYRLNNNNFYCYLDGYYEDEEKIHVFEVKAITSSAYDDCMVSLNNKKKVPLFVKDDNNIIHYMGNKLIEEAKVSIDKINQSKKALLDRYNKKGKYIYDVAIQRHIIEESLKKAKEKPKDITYYLIVLNASYQFSGKYDEAGKPIYDTDENGEDLFKVYDVTNLTFLYLDQIEKERNTLLNNLQHLTINTNISGRFCEYKKTTACKFCKICLKKLLVDGSIYEYLMRHCAFKEPDEKGKLKNIDIYDLINKNICKIDEARPYISKIDNITQYDCYVKNQIYIDKERMKKGLSHITYPIYYLDFESYNCPLPRFYHERPYSQSLFQYSLHIEKAPNTCDLVKSHHEFLAKDHLDHRLELTKQLIKDIDLSSGGTVIVYNKSFEQTRLKELALFYPMYKDELYKIHDHIFDLFEVLAGSKNLYGENKEIPHFTYYNNLLHGSFSIKKVLPVFTDLTYSTLDVQNGTQAIVTYGMLPYLTKKEYEEKYLALSIYCRQDTWAMVEILKGLKKILEA